MNNTILLISAVTLGITFAQGQSRPDSLHSQTTIQSTTSYQGYPSTDMTRVNVADLPAHRYKKHLLTRYMKVGRIAHFITTVYRGNILTSPSAPYRPSSTMRKTIQDGYDSTARENVNRTTSSQRWPYEK